MDIEKRALELVNAASEQSGLDTLSKIGLHHWSAIYKALLRAIEAHEADNARHAAEMEAFRREVSEAVLAVFDAIHYSPSARLAVRQGLSRFIIPKPDPLADNLPFVLKLLRYHETGGHEGDGSDHALREARKELEALAARGLELVKKEPSQ